MRLKIFLSNIRIFSRNFYIAKAIALAMFPLVLLVLPVTFFDSGPEFCLFTRLSGIHCPGCGMTRACMHIIHLDIVPALNYNKLAFVVLPIMCILLAVEFFRTIKIIRKYDEFVAWRKGQNTPEIKS